MAETPESRTRLWRRCLGLGDVRAAREEYARRRAALSACDAASKLSGDPLTAAADSEWGRHLQRQETNRIVALDLQRLFPGHAFFAHHRVRSALGRVLETWSSCNSAVGYKQGLHELAALLLCVVFKDCDGRQNALADPDACPGDVLACAEASDGHAPAAEVDERMVEPDTYALFDALLGGGGRATRNGLSVLLYYEDEVEGQVSSVRRASERVYAALQHADAPLHAKLVELGVEPALFLLRWLRLCFVREFHLDDVCVVWDFIMRESAPGGALATADGGPAPNVAVEAVAVAMLMFMRNHLLAATDFGAAMKRLAKFPPVEDVGVITEQARALIPLVGPAVARAARA